MYDSGYATSDDGTPIAFIVAGSGSPTVVYSDATTPADLMVDGPMRAFVDRIASFARLVCFDRRGTAASGGQPASSRVVEQVADDVLSVLDAVEESRAVLLDFAMPPAMVFAATYPNRTSALALIDPTARWLGERDYSGLRPEQVELALATIEREWGTGVVNRLTGQPSTEALRRWWGRCERLCNTPADAAAGFRAMFGTDLRSILPAISVPTLVVARRGYPGQAQSRFVADRIPGSRYVEVERSEHYIEAALDEVEEFVTGRLPAHVHDRVLATVLFTDIVDSTATNARRGDRAWLRRVDEHDALVRRELTRYRGREVKTMGDGFLVVFDGPARAVRFGCTIRDAAAELGLRVRVGLHTGEIEPRGDDVAGLAVNIAARVVALAGPGEVLVSRTVTDLVVGSGIVFDDRGEYELKGMPGMWRLFAVESP